MRGRRRVAGALTIPLLLHACGGTFTPRGTYEYDGPPGGQWTAVDFRVRCVRCDVRWGTLQDLRTDRMEGIRTFGLGVPSSTRTTTLVLVATPADSTIRVQELSIEVDDEVLAASRVGPVGQPLRVEAHLPPTVFGRGG